jgi:GxxExxY protein
MVRIIPMATNNAVSSAKIIYPELSYAITGILYAVHNELGQYAREKQYGDLLKEKLAKSDIHFQRELAIGRSGNILDFVIDNKIAIELKAAPMLTREHYRQTQNYLQQSGLKLALLVNFRSKVLKPARVIRIDSASASNS